ncbi:MAG: FecR domain-containing protein [Sphingobium yanoikuyae]|nr:FecR domain-containing protein [Sphingobium yanoikuyae]
MSETSKPPGSPSDPAAPDAILREQAQHWVARLAGGDVDEAQLSILEAWLASDRRHALAFARERALWQDLRAAFDRPTSSHDLPSGADTFPLRRRLAWFVPAAMAASLAFFLAAPSVMLDLRSDHRSAIGEVRSIALPDGTTAMLDSGAALSVDFDDKQRIVHLLAGRAWFDVRHEGRPFLVEAERGMTRDIGTSFEVDRKEGSVEIGVTQGTVQVRSPDGMQGPPMHAGERMRYSASELSALPAVPTSQLAPWRRGEILLDRQPIRAAIAELARYRSASVWAVGDFSKEAPISGMFLIERPEEALQTLVRMRQLRVIRLPGGHMIIRPATKS